MAKVRINGQEIFGNVHIGEGGDVANPNIADVYDPTQTYNTGDRRIYNDVLYVCNDDNVTGAWDSTKWDSATIDEIISALKVQDLDNVTLTTSDNNKLLGVSVSGSDISVGAVNPLNGFQIKTYSFNFPNAVGNQVIEVDTGVSEAYLLGCTVDRLVDGVSRYDFIGQYNQSGYCVGFLNNSGSLNVRPYIIDAGGATAYGGRPAKAIFAVKYS